MACALQTFGTEHAHHIIVHLMSKKLPQWKTWSAPAMNLIRFLSGRDYVDHLSTTCFSRRGTAEILFKLQGFKCISYEHRFDSVCEFIDHVVPLKTNLHILCDESNRSKKVE